jgi:hypothetical protein
MGWRINYAVQILVCIIRVVILVYLIYALATQFSDVELSSIRICLLAVVVLSSCSLTPLFYISYKCKWLLNMRPIEDNFRSNSHNANKAREVRTRTRERERIETKKVHLYCSNKESCSVLTYVPFYFIYCICDCDDNFTVYLIYQNSCIQISLVYNNLPLLPLPLSCHTI